jgi:hypothetical protein
MWALWCVFFVEGGKLIGVKEQKTYSESVTFHAFAVFWPTSIYLHLADRWFAEYS